MTSIAVYSVWWNIIVGYYRSTNAHRTLEVAIQKEKEWELNKPDEEDLWDDDDDEDDEDDEEGDEEAEDEDDE